VKRYLVLMLIGLFTIGIATVAQAQATRTWVSGVGDDVNPCSRTAPCKTYAGAISKTANQGVISTLDPGGFGGVTITKSIMIDGTGQIGGVLVSGSNGITVNATSTDVVVLRMLEIHGANLGGINGVNILNAAEVNVENCRIQNFSNDGIRIANTTGTTKVVVRNSDIRNNLRGIETITVVPGVTQLVVSECGISGHQSGSGVDVAGQNNKAAVLNSSLTHNLVGIQTQINNSTASVTGSLVAFNGTGVSGNGEIRLHNSTVVNNTVNGVTGTTRGFQSNMIIDNVGGNTVTNSVAAQ
jgi:Right handed beta helix region